ncbi:HEAT repeat domain-containing protein [Mariniflexile sp. HMF6888]|uniref:HEAT repeat domain-containing protein n=1 Tax=Mariniflexile sp. HMF6888 TaxID=3373086 RepID=UPI0037914B97
MAKNFLETFLQNYMVPILMLLLLVLVIIIVYHRLRFVYLSYRKRQYHTKISDALTELTFSGYEGELLKAEVAKFKSRFPYHKKWFKKLLLSSVLDLSLTLKGDLIYQVREIYMAFELHKHSLKLIKHPYWYIKCIGINHFQTMNFVHGQKYIKSYITSKNVILRSNAYIAHLYLTTESFDSLVDYPTPLSRVNMYKVIDVLYMKHDTIPKNIASWLEAKNESIVILGLKIMVFYNYIAAPEKIVSLLDHEQIKVREEAILSIGELFLIDAEEALHSQFDKEGKLLKIEILKSLTVIGSETSVSFITSVLKRKHMDKDVKMELLRSLKSIDNQYYDTRFILDLEIDSMKAHLNCAYL